MQPRPGPSILLSDHLESSRTPGHSRSRTTSITATTSSSSVESVIVDPFHTKANNNSSVGDPWSVDLLNGFGSKEPTPLTAEPSCSSPSSSTKEITSSSNNSCSSSNNSGSSGRSSMNDSAALSVDHNHHNALMQIYIPPAQQQRSCCNDNNDNGTSPSTLAQPQGAIVAQVLHVIIADESSSTFNSEMTHKKIAKKRRKQNGGVDVEHTKSSKEYLRKAQESLKNQHSMKYTTPITVTSKDQEDGWKPQQPQQHDLTIRSSTGLPPQRPPLSRQMQAASSGSSFNNSHRYRNGSGGESLWSKEHAGFSTSASTSSDCTNLYGYEDPDKVVVPNTSTRRMGGPARRRGSVTKYSLQAVAAAAAATERLQLRQLKNRAHVDAAQLASSMALMERVRNDEIDCDAAMMAPPPVVLVGDSASSSSRPTCRRQGSRRGLLTKQYSSERALHTLQQQHANSLRVQGHPGCTIIRRGSFGDNMKSLESSGNSNPMESTYSGGDRSSRLSAWRHRNHLRMNRQATIESDSMHGAGSHHRSMPSASDTPAVEPGRSYRNTYTTNNSRNSRNCSNNLYEYEDPDIRTVPKNDDTATNPYGYEDPDAAAASKNYPYGNEDPDNAAATKDNLYGYEDPDAAAASRGNPYGYEDPGTAAAKINPYGYEEPDGKAAEKNFLGYEEPDPVQTRNNYAYGDPTVVAPRRPARHRPQRRGSVTKYSLEAAKTVSLSQLQTPKQSHCNLSVPLRSDRVMTANRTPSSGQLEAPELKMPVRQLSPWQLTREKVKLPPPQRRFSRSSSSQHSTSVPPSRSESFRSNPSCELLSASSEDDNASDSDDDHSIQSMEIPLNDCPISGDKPAQLPSRHDSLHSVHSQTSVFSNEEGDADSLAPDMQSLCSISNHQRTSSKEVVSAPPLPAFLPRTPNTAQQRRKLASVSGGYGSDSSKHTSGPSFFAMRNAGVVSAPMVTYGEETASPLSTPQMFGHTAFTTHLLLPHD